MYRFGKILANTAMICGLIAAVCNTLNQGISVAAKLREG